MTTHTLKTNQVYWNAVCEGDKTFEVRPNDRGFQKGDRLVLLPENWCECGRESCSANNGKPLPMTRLITYVYSGDPSLRDNGGVVPGYVVLGLWDETLGESHSLPATPDGGE